MTKYQEITQLKCAIRRALKHKEIKAEVYQFPHVEKQKKTSDWPEYIPENPFYP